MWTSHRFGQRENSDQMVGNGRELRRSRLTGQNVETLVKLERVSADDFGLQALRDVDRKIGFTHRRRAGQHHVSQFVHVNAKTRALLKNAGHTKLQGL